MDERPGKEREEQQPLGERQVLWRVNPGDALANWATEAADWMTAPPFLPQETRRHLYAARREMLLAMRSMIDKSLERVEDAERRTQNDKPTKIQVD